LKLVENIKYNRLIFVLRPNKFSASFHAKTCNFFSFYQACRSQVLNTVWTEILVKKVSTSIRKSVASSLQNPKLQKWVASSDISRLWPNCLELSRLLKTVETLGQTVKTFRGKCWQGSTIDTHGLKIQGRGSRLSGKITSGVPYFGFYCIFINMCLNLPGGGPIFTLSPPPPPCMNLWAQYVKKSWQFSKVGLDCEDFSLSLGWDRHRILSTQLHVQ
jgi:hypothetical protein